MLAAPTRATLNYPCCHQITSAVCAEPTRARMGQQVVAGALTVRNPAFFNTRCQGAEAAFSTEEADTLIDRLYESTSGLPTIYAAYFRFFFYTGMRAGEVIALRWSRIDRRQKSAPVCRTQIRGVSKDRTKTKRTRKVLLNDRALHALEKARPLTKARSDYVFAPSGTGDRSEMFIRSETSQKRYWLAALRELGISTAGCTTRATRTRLCA